MNRISSRLVLAAAAALLTFGAGSVEAQTTFTACRVPSVGAIYMIGVTGAPSACLDASHVEFSWTEGGAPGAGSVTSTAILDGTIAAADIGADAVTTAAILDGTIVAADLATGAVGSAAILNGSIIGADLATGAVGSTEILNGSIAAADLSAGALPSGVEFATVSTLNPDLTIQTASSIAVTHPGSGYLVASAVGQTSCTANQSLTVGISTSGSLTDNYTYNIEPSGWVRVVKEEVITVSGAGTTTLNFNVGLTGVDNCGLFRTISFSAIYVPNRY